MSKKEIHVQVPVGLLGVAFVVLKLTGVIAWSWWWVTAPFWGPVALAIGIVAIVGLFALIGYTVVAVADSLSRRRRA